MKISKYKCWSSQHISKSENSETWEDKRGIYINKQGVSFEYYVYVDKERPKNTFTRITAIYNGYTHIIDFDKALTIFAIKIQCCKLFKEIQK